MAPGGVVTLTYTMPWSSVGMKPVGSTVFTPQVAAQKNQQQRNGNQAAAGHHPHQALVALGQALVAAVEAGEKPVNQPLLGRSPSGIGS